MQVSVKSNVKRLSKQLARFHTDQVPFATALALTKTAQEAQKEIQQKIPQRFNVTKKWWLKQQPTGIKIKPATKRRLVSEVFTRAHFAGLQEEGGTKRPHKGGKIVVPSDHIKSVRRRRSGGASEVINSPRSFFIKTKTGKTAVMQKRGKKRGTARLMYVFTPSARIKPRFKFKETAARKVAAVFDREFKKAIIRAIRTAK